MSQPSTKSCRALSADASSADIHAAHRHKMRAKRWLRRHGVPKNIKPEDFGFRTYTIPHKGFLGRGVRQIQARAIWREAKF